jgi:hypothetical protein
MADATSYVRSRTDFLGVDEQDVRLEDLNMATRQQFK